MKSDETVTLDDMLVDDLDLEAEIAEARAHRDLSQESNVARKDDVSKSFGVDSVTGHPLPDPLLDPRRVTHKPEDRDLVGHAVGLVRARWLKGAGALIEPREWLDELSAHDVDSIIHQVEQTWNTVYEAVLPDLIQVVNDAIQRGMLSMPETVNSVEHLKALGAQWLDSFARTMIHRWVGSRIRRAVADAATLEDQSLAVVKAVEAVPDAFSIVLQPLIRRVLSFGGLLQEIERSAPHVSVQKDARESQKYVIVTAGDTKVCKVCLYVSNLGTFWLKDALDLFDNFIEAVQEDKFAEELLSGGWLSEKEIVGRTRTELKNLGQILPPMHVSCRCGIAFVRS